MGRRRFLIIIGILGIGTIVLFSSFLMTEASRTRDAQRLRDMRTLEYHFQQAFLTYGSFRQAQLPALNDPGTFSYVIGTSTDTTFRVQFRLERRYEDLNSGDHTLTEKGIQ